MPVEHRLDTEQLDKLFRELISNSSNLKPVLNEIAEDLLDAVEQNFEDESSAGIPWPKLSKRRIEERTAAGTWPGKMLQVSGRLAASMGQTVLNDRIDIGTNVEYAAPLFFGDAENFIPKRNPLVFSDQVIDDTVQKLLDYLVDV